MYIKMTPQQAIDFIERHSISPESWQNEHRYEMKDAIRIIREAIGDNKPISEEVYNYRISRIKRDKDGKIKFNSNYANNYAAGEVYYYMLLGDRDKILIGRGVLELEDFARNAGFEFIDD